MSRCGCTVVKGVPAAAPPAAPDAAAANNETVIPFWGFVALGPGAEPQTWFALTSTGFTFTNVFTPTAVPMPTSGTVTRVRYNVTEQSWGAPILLALWTAPPLDGGETNSGAFDVVVNAGDAPIAVTVDAEQAFAEGDRLAIGMTLPTTVEPTPVVRVQGTIWIRLALP